jgi:hypothetical protein
MNASGEKWTVRIGSTDYYFDSCYIQCAGKVIDTPLIGGGIYRCRALPGVYELTFGVSKPHSSMAACRTLLATAAAGSCTITIGQTVFSDCMLRRGGFNARAGEEKSAFEITFTGVST